MLKKYLVIAEMANRESPEIWYGTSEFTNQAITDLADTAEGVPVTMDFDDLQQIGTVRDAKNMDGKLVLIVELNDNIMINSNHRIVPRYTIDGRWDDGDRRRRIIERASSLNYGLTDKPLCNDLPSIIPIKD